MSPTADFRGLANKRPRWVDSGPSLNRGRAARLRRFQPFGVRSTARVLNGYPIGEIAKKYRATAVHN